MARIRIRDTIYFLGVLVIGIFLAGWTVLTYLTLISNLRDLPSVFVELSSTVLVCFLVLLLVRYLLLLWASFAQHVDSLRFDERNKDVVFTPSVTVLVPAYNEGAAIESAIQSLLELVYPDLEILVINDGSKDDTLERAQKWAGSYSSATVRVIDTVQNVGKAEALNIGIRNSDREIIVCMDADSRLEPQSIMKGVAHFQDPEVKAVAGNVKIINRVNFLSRLQTLEYLIGLNLVRRAQGYFQCVNIIPGPMGFFRREVLLEVGAYESDTYAEDCDLTLKLLARGMRINYEPEAVSWTECPEEVIPLITQRYRWTRGILQALVKNRSSLFKTKDSGLINTLVLWYMLFEAIAWPIMNIFGNVFFLSVAAYYGAVNILLLWWLIMVLLDMTGALHTVTFEKEELSLVFYSIPYRMFFIFGVDITKVLATFEELFKIEMTWGTIERKGRTAKSS